MATARKNMHGEWQCESEVALPDNRIMRINTSKRSSGQLATTATVGRMDGAFFTFMMFQDFNRTLRSAKVRCTQRVVEEMHDDVLNDIDTVKAAVEEFYAKKKATV